LAILVGRDRKSSYWGVAEMRRRCEENQQVLSSLHASSVVASTLDVIEGVLELSSGEVMVGTIALGSGERA
jgi:hypothetical protein